VGWVYEDEPGHEGYPVGLVEQEVEFTYKNDGPGGSTYLRELSYYQDHDREVPKGGLRPVAFQVACDCGWRSRRFHAPLVARYVPHSLELGDELAEEEARQIWVRHVREVAEDEKDRVRARLFPYKGG
jgi:hypothetical protein